MTIDITINGFVFMFLAVFLVGFLVGLLVVGARWFYYRRLVMQMKRRVTLAETISELTDQMKAKHQEIEQPLKNFLNSLLDLAHENKIILPLLLSLPQVKKGAKPNEKKTLEEMSEKLKMATNSEIFADTMVLMYLCILHASTYSFFFGPMFYKRLSEFVGVMPDLQESAIVDDKKPIGMAFSKKKTIVQRLQSFPFPNDFFGGTAKHA